MGVQISKPYKYGADADGNRYIWVRDTEFYSDISNNELSEDELYEYDDGLLCSYDELVQYLEIKKQTAQPNENIVCCCCDEPIEEGSIYFIWDDEIYDEDCLHETLIDQFKISAEDAIEQEEERQEAAYEDYLVEQAEAAREARALEELDKYDL